MLSYLGTNIYCMEEYDHVLHGYGTMHRQEYDDYVHVYSGIRYCVFLLVVIHVDRVYIVHD